MKYIWEDNEDFEFAALAAQNEMPDGYRVIGVIIGNEDTGEGCVKFIDSNESAMWDADVLNDAKHDLQDAYERAFENAFSGAAE